MAQSTQIDDQGRVARDTPSPSGRFAAQTPEAIAAHKFPVAIKPGIVSGFSPMRTEINPLPLMRKLEAAGAKLALPVVAGRGLPLIMRAWNFGDPLARGVWGIRQPTADAPEVAPDIVLTPLGLLRHDDHETACSQAGHCYRYRLRHPGS
jgi:5-formyltetrahydrofolate cyclo-ligase